MSRNDFWKIALLQKYFPNFIYTMHLKTFKASKSKSNESLMGDHLLVCLLFLFFSTSLFLQRSISQTS